MKKYFLAACLILLISGCGKSAEEKAIEEQIEKETGMKTNVDISNDSVKISGKSEGEEYSFSTGNDAEIPKNFPKDIPVYKPSKTMGGAAVEEGFSVMLTTKDSMDKVASFYKEKMKGSGWSEEFSMDMGGQTVLVFEKDGRSLNIAAMPLGGETRITLAVAEEE